MPSAPCACAATLRPSACAVCAVSTIAFISSRLYCASSGLSPSEMTPPVALNLITSAPHLMFSRTFAVTPSTPLATPSLDDANCGARKFSSPWPPVMLRAGPEASRVFKLDNAAAKTWRRLKGENQLPKIVQGIKFQNGIEVIEMPAHHAA